MQISDLEFMRQKLANGAVTKSVRVWTRLSGRELNLLRELVAGSQAGMVKITTPEHQASPSPRIDREQEAKRLTTQRPWLVLTASLFFRNTPRHKLERGGRD